jgi:hypothetical protein
MQWCSGAVVQWCRVGVEQGGMVLGSAQIGCPTHHIKTVSDTNIQYSTTY